MKSPPLQPFLNLYPDGNRDATGDHACPDPSHQAIAFTQKKSRGDQADGGGDVTDLTEKHRAAFLLELKEHWKGQTCDDDLCNGRSRREGQLIYRQ